MSMNPGTYTCFEPPSPEPDKFDKLIQDYVQKSLIAGGTGHKHDQHSAHYAYLRLRAEIKREIEIGVALAGEKK